MSLLGIDKAIRRSIVLQHSVLLKSYVADMSGRGLGRNKEKAAILKVLQIRICQAKGSDITASET